MKNEFDSIFMKDLLPKIDRVAIDCQRPPNMLFTKSGDEQMLLVQNASVAAFNLGVLRYREMLLKELVGDEDDG